MGTLMNENQVTKSMGKAFGLLAGEVALDSFAGGGGASTGIEQVLGCSVDIAINHNLDAIEMHKMNHPNAQHYCEDIWDVDPEEALLRSGGNSIGLAWWSPDCTHFSIAKGGTPVNQAIRGLAWVVIKWALRVPIRVNFLENVKEFRTWGSLLQDDNGDWRPDPDRKGETFKDFTKALTVGLSPRDPSWKECVLACGIQYDIKQKLKLFKGLQYDVDFRELVASDYGAPTIRKRLFMVMRNDGQPIEWPEITHGDPALNKQLVPQKVAADVIDWTIPVKSIFNRKKPLVEKTMARIAKGLQKFVFDSDAPYIVEHKNQRPFITEHANASSQRNMPIDEPLRTICAQVKGGHFAVVSADLEQAYPNEQNSDSTSVKDNKQELLAFMAKHFTGCAGASIDDPLATITGVDHNALVTANVEKSIIPTYEEWIQSTEKWGGTRAEYDRLFGEDVDTVTTSHVIKMRGTNLGHTVSEPAHTVSAGGNHLGIVNSFLIKYFGSNFGTDINTPVHTLTTKERFGLVVVQGEVMVKMHGAIYRVLDIGMRMLEPHELFLAQGFPKNYQFQFDQNGKKISKAKQVARCGNSVCPPVAKALVSANIKHIPLNYALPLAA